MRQCDLCGEYKGDDMMGMIKIEMIPKRTSCEDVKDCNKYKYCAMKCEETKCDYRVGIPCELYKDCCQSLSKET